jgi:glyoxylase-like metal-dependent hydrolase (beta-lactamase superfamily II)
MRRHFVIALGLLLLSTSHGWAWKTASGFSMDWPNVTVETQKLSGSTYCLHGSGANVCASVGPDGILLVDAEFEPMTIKIKKALTALDPGPVRYLIDTHWHTDHTGGNADFAKTGTVVIAQRNVLLRMQSPQFLPFLNLKCDPAPREAWPKITYNDAMTLSFNGEDIQLFHLGPAHTDGDTVVYFPKSNVLCMGDIYINGLYPIIDLGSAGTINGYFGMIDKALTLANAETKVVPGHGPVATVKDLIAYRDMLLTLRDRVLSMKADGKSLPEILQANPSHEFDAAWASDRVGPDGVTKMIYESLSPH